MKTQKRHSDTPDIIDKRDLARWKRKNRTAQLKRTIARLQKELADCDTSRQLARHLLGENKDFFIRSARAAKDDPEARTFWLEQAGTINFFLCLTMSNEEQDRAFSGEEVAPVTMQFTDEEREILRKKREEKQQQSETAETFTTAEPTETP